MQIFSVEAPHTTIGSSGADTYFGAGVADQLSGAAGNDILVGGAGSDVLNGGADFDVASYVTSTNGVSVNLASGTGWSGDATGDTLSGIESLRGSMQADYLYGNSDHNIIEGGSGADLIYGDAGNDWVSHEHATGPIAVNLALSTDSGYLGDAAGDDISSVENILGSAFNDFLYGDTGANILRGGAGGDVLYGAGNSDTIDYSDNTIGITVDLSTNSALGGLAQGDTLVSVENVVATPYNDSLVGDSASNTLYGWYGLEQLTGNGSNDIFVWRSIFDSGVVAGQRDVVTDFYRVHGDVLDVSGIDADGNAANGNQAFQFIGTANFTAAGQLRFFFEGANTVFEINTTGTSGAEMAVLLSNGNTALLATDFML